jgi:chromosome segregation ATPase
MPHRAPAPAPSKRTGHGDFWCCLILSFLAFTGYGWWAIPARDRTLSNFTSSVESKLRWTYRALGGELDAENHRLNTSLQLEKQKEGELRKGEDAMKAQLRKAHSEESMLQQQLNQKEFHLKSLQKDAMQARNGLQNWHHKSDALQTRLMLVQKDDVRKQTDLQKSHHEASLAEERTKRLERELNEAQRKVAALETGERSLRGMVQKQERWHHDTVEKLKRYRDTEKTLMKSIDISAA